METKVQPAEAVQRIQHADVMGPLQLLVAYAEQRDLDAAALSCAKDILQVGTEFQHAL